MRKPPHSASIRRAEGRIRTGAAAHLLGGGLDLLAAIAVHLAERARGRVARLRSGPSGL